MKGSEEVGSADMRDSVRGVSPRRRNQDAADSAQGSVTAEGFAGGWYGDETEF